MVLLSQTSFDACSTPKLTNPFTTRIFSDVAGDITIAVDGESFLLHKFPLVARSGKIRRMLGDGNASKLELLNLPGGVQAFELAVKFCYGMNFEITSSNVAQLRCIGEYLEMTDEYRDDNLISRTDTYLNEIVIHSLEKSVQVLVSCEALSPVAEGVGITNACVEAIAMNACKEQLVSGLCRLELDYAVDSTVEWWIEDLSLLQIGFYQRVISAMTRKGIRSHSIVASLMHYAEASLEGTAKSQLWNPLNEQIVIIETLVSLMPTDKSCVIPVSFLFGMLKMAIMMDTNIACRLELERRISFRLELVSLDDLLRLVPSPARAGDVDMRLFDVDTVHRMVINFLQRVEEEEESEECGYESEQDQGLGSPNHGCLLKVGRLIDAYLAEIAVDPYLSLKKFIAMMEILPDYARVIDDGLYRAVDIYLKVHPKLTEQECKRLCHLIDCEKLSHEASSHAARNDRLPVQMTVRVLYFEQLRLKNSMSISGNIGDGFMSQRINSGVASAGMSPRDNYASLRRENRELKLEISRMRVRLSELEKEQSFMKQGMVSKSGNGTTFLTSLSKGIGRMGIFSSSQEERRKAARRPRGSGKKCIQTSKCD